LIFELALVKNEFSRGKIMTKA